MSPVKAADSPELTKVASVSIPKNQNSDDQRKNLAKLKNRLIRKRTSSEFTQKKLPNKLSPSLIAAKAILKQHSQQQVVLGDDNGDMDEDDNQSHSFNDSDHGHKSMGDLNSRPKAV